MYIIYVGCQSLVCIQLAIFSPNSTGECEPGLSGGGGYGGGGVNWSVREGVG